MANRKSVLRDVLRGTVKVHAAPKRVDPMRPFMAPQPTEGQGGVGTGFFVNSKASQPNWFTVLTCYHVIAGCASSDVHLSLPSLGQQQLPAAIIGVSPEYDLAVIAVKLDLQQQQAITILKMGDDASSEVGAPLRACGYPSASASSSPKAPSTGIRTGGSSTPAVSTAATAEARSSTRPAR